MGSRCGGDHRSGPKHGCTGEEMPPIDGRGPTINSVDRGHVRRGCEGYERGPVVSNLERMHMKRVKRLRVGLGCQGRRLPLAHARRTSRGHRRHREGRTPDNSGWPGEHGTAARHRHDLTLPRAQKDKKMG